MRRAHEGNPDYKADDPTKIHWAKFDMLGKFIASTSQYQPQCRGPNGYSLYENPAVSHLFDVPVMDYEVGSFLPVSTPSNHLLDQRCNNLACILLQTMEMPTRHLQRQRCHWNTRGTLEIPVSSSDCSFGRDFNSFLLTIFDVWLFFI